MKPCKRCGAMERYADGECVPCGRAYAVRYRAENPAKVRARRVRYCAENPEKVLAANARYRAKNPEKVRATRQRCDTARRAIAKACQQSTRLGSGVP